MQARQIYPWGDVYVRGFELVTAATSENKCLQTPLTVELLVSPLVISKKRNQTITILCVVLNVVHDKEIQRSKFDF